jgi:hypothetical protein
MSVTFGIFLIFLVAFNVVVDDDRLTKQYFARAHTVERRAHTVLSLYTVAKSIGNFRHR